MNNKSVTLKNDTIYTIGAFLKPVQVEINGIKQWRWIVVGFEDSTFLDGKEIEVFDYSETVEGLLKENEILK
jgi:hypothetical protein